MRNNARNFTPRNPNQLPIVAVDEQCRAWRVNLPIIPRKGDVIDGELIGRAGYEYEVTRIYLTEPDPNTCDEPHLTLFITKMDESMPIEELFRCEAMKLIHIYVSTVENFTGRQCTELTITMPKKKGTERTTTDQTKNTILLHIRHDNDTTEPRSEAPQGAERSADDMK